MQPVIRRLFPFYSFKPGGVYEDSDSNRVNITHLIQYF